MRPKFYKRIFDSVLISKALGISVDDVVNEFKDGRIAGRFAEHWVGEIYSTDVGNYNTPGYDTSRSDPLFGDLKIAVRSLGKGRIKFQSSKNIGSGRTCTTDDLLETLENIDYYIVVDVQDFPGVKFIPIEAKWLIKLVKKGSLTCGGWSRSRFYEIGVRYDIEWEII